MSHNYFTVEPETAKICIQTVSTLKQRGEILLGSKIGKKKKSPRSEKQNLKQSNFEALQASDRATVHPLANGTLFFRKGFGGRPKTVTVRTQP